MIAMLLWTLVSGVFALWVCSLVSCPTPPGYVGHHRYTGEKKQWLVYGASEEWAVQLSEYNKQELGVMSDEDQVSQAQESLAAKHSEPDADAVGPSLVGSGVLRAGAPSRSCAGAEGVVDRTPPAASLVAYANPFYLGAEYPAGDFRRVLVDHLVTGGGRDPIFA